MPPKIFAHVPATFPPGERARIAFVGTAPEDEEVIGGAPLIGPTGRVFNTALGNAHVDRGACLVTNVFDEQAPKDDPLLWCRSTKEKSAWAGYELPPLDRGKWLPPDKCWHLDRLADEIARADPNVIVAMGNIALWAFAGGPRPISVWRGCTFEARMIAPGRKVLPTFHPAAILHSDYKLIHLLSMDFAKALRESEDKRVLWTPRTIYMEPTIEAIEAWAARVEALGAGSEALVSIDIETLPSFRQIKCVAVGIGHGEIMVIPFVDTRALGKSYWPDEATERRAIEALKRMCECAAPKVGQNFSYDWWWLWEKWGIAVRNYRHDTRLLMHARYPEMPKDLGTLGACYDRVGPWKWLRAKDANKRED